MISAVITAAGNGTRFGQNKLWSKLNARPVIEQTINQFIKIKNIDEIIVVIKPGDASKYQSLVKNDVRIKLVEGGQERIISLFNGVTAVRGEVTIAHDGARPLVSVSLIKKLIKSGLKYQAVMTALKPAATVKLVKNNQVQSSLLREETYLAQTPQIFSKKLLLRALSQAIKERFFLPTDDSEIVARFTGIKVRVIVGEETNIKITRPIDLILANQLIKEGKA